MLLGSIDEHPDCGVLLNDGTGKRNNTERKRKTESEINNIFSFWSFNLHRHVLNSKTHVYKKTNQLKIKDFKA